LSSEFLALALYNRTI